MDRSGRCYGTPSRVCLRLEPVTSEAVRKVNSTGQTDHVYDALARVFEGLEALTKFSLFSGARPATSGSRKHWKAGQGQAARLGGKASCWAAHRFLSPKYTERIGWE